MPLFYFHLRDAGSLIEDLEGSPLPDLASACAEAHASARELAAQLIRSDRLLDGQCIEVADTSGEVIASVPLRNAVISR